MRRQSHEVGVNIMQRPRSYPSSMKAPETDMSRQRMEPGPPQWEASTLAKSYSNSLLITIKEHIHEITHACPQCMCYMNTHELHSHVCRISRRVFYIRRQSHQVGVNIMQRPRSSPFSILEHQSLTCPGREWNQALHSGRRAL